MFNSFHIEEHYDTQVFDEHSSLSRGVFPVPSDTFFSWPIPLHQQHSSPSPDIQRFAPRPQLSLHPSPDIRRFAPRPQLSLHPLQAQRFAPRPQHPSIGKFEKLVDRMRDPAPREQMRKYLAARLATEKTTSQATLDLKEFLALADTLVPTPASTGDVHALALTAGAAEESLDRYEMLALIKEKVSSGDFSRFLFELECEEDEAFAERMLRRKWRVVREWGREGAGVVTTTPAGGTTQHALKVVAGDGSGRMRSGEAERRRELRASQGKGVGTSPSREPGQELGPAEKRAAGVVVDLFDTGAAESKLEEEREQLEHKKSLFGGFDDADRLDDFRAAREEEAEVLESRSSEVPENSSSDAAAAVAPPSPADEEQSPSSAKPIHAPNPPPSSTLAPAPWVRALRSPTARKQLLKAQKSASKPFAYDRNSGGGKDFRFVCPLYRRRRLKWLERFSNKRHTSKELKYKAHWLTHPDQKPVFPDNKGATNVEWPSPWH